MQARTFRLQNKGRGKDQKGKKARKGPTLSPDSRPAWIVATPLNLANHPFHVMDLGCKRSIGSRTAVERLKKHAWYCGITTEYCRCEKSVVFANSETNLQGKLHYQLFQQLHHVLPRLMYLRQVCCAHFVFPLSEVGTTIELDTKGEKIHVQLLVCVPLQRLDESCVAASDQVA